MIIEATFELITCHSHSQEMNFMSYLYLLFYLKSSHIEIRLNRTLLRLANIFLQIVCIWQLNRKGQNRTPSWIYVYLYVYVHPVYLNISAWLVCCYGCILYIWYILLNILQIKSSINYVINTYNPIVLYINMSYF